MCTYQRQAHRALLAYDENRSVMQDVNYRLTSVQCSKTRAVMVAGGSMCRQPARDGNKKTVKQTHALGRPADRRDRERGGGRRDVT